MARRGFVHSAVNDDITLCVTRIRDPPRDQEVSQWGDAGKIPMSPCHSWSLDGSQNEIFYCLSYACKSMSTINFYVY